MPNRNRKHSLTLLVLAIVIMVVCAASAGAQTTSFTYQGRLTDAGNGANGNYDLQFTLWDSGNGGLQQPQPGPVTVTKNNVSVSSGIFTVQLDFTVNSFPGSDRFLEIGVRPAGAGSFAILSPRQQISATPYAIRTLSAASADTATNATQLGGVAASQYVQTSDSRLTDSRPPTAGSSDYIQNIQNASTQQASANFNISGNGTVGGTLSGGLINASTQFNINGNRVLSASSLNLFAGVGAGQMNTGARNTFVGQNAGPANSSGGFNAFFGSLSGLNNATGSNNAFFGASAGAANSAGGSNAFFGSLAGLSNTGSDNSFFGALAGQANTANTGNSFFGTRAGSSIPQNDHNSFFGTDAGGNMTCCNDNSIFGYQAGQNATNSGNGSFFGYQAGMSTRNGNNSFFGYKAGSNNIDGYNNTLIGSNADVGLNNLTDATAIGANARVQCSNCLVLGDPSNSNLRVGIGNSLPAAGLEISRGAPWTSNLWSNALLFENAAAIGWHGNVGNQRFGIGQSTGGLYFFRTTSNFNDTSQPANYIMTLTDGGLVGINTTSPGVNLDVNGQARIRSIPPGGAFANQVCFTAQGDLLQCTSSLRYKTNVQPFVGGLNTLQKLRPISFNWKQGGQPDIGLGAEDVAKVAPLFVSRDDKGEPVSVNYAGLSVLFINAIKEQQAQIESLRKANAVLTSRLRALGKTSRQQAIRRRGRL